jgi:hypothetical protein
VRVIDCLLLGVLNPFRPHSALRGVVVQVSLAIVLGKLVVGVWEL